MNAINMRSSISNKYIANAYYVHKQQGMTLIELMIGSLIGIFLLIGVYNIYISGKKTMSYQKERSNLQNEAQFAFSFIADKLQQAGDFGCSNIAGKLTSSSLVNTDSKTFRPWRAIEGWEADSTGTGDPITLNESASVLTVSSQNNNNYQLSSNWATSTQEAAALDTSVKSVRNSDIIKIWYTDTDAGKITATNGADITLSTVDVKKGDIVVLNDCETILMAQVCACDAGDITTPCAGTDTHINIANTCSDLSPGNKIANLNKLNLSTAEARKLKQAIFYVSKQGANANNAPSLYWKELNQKASAGTAKPVLENVENIQFLYGEDTDNDASPNYYVTADAVTHWSDIVSLKINLLLRSYQKILSTETAITFNGITTMPPSGDHYMRYSFSTTIALRNQLLAK
jgi:type IV pilus assembly protein PilW